MDQNHQTQVLEARFFTQQAELRVWVRLMRAAIPYLSQQERLELANDLRGIIVIYHDNYLPLVHPDSSFAAELTDFINEANALLTALAE